MAATKPKPRQGAKPQTDSKSAGPAKSKLKPRSLKAKPEVKTKRTSAGKTKKRKIYTPEELGVPKLNGIIPVGVQKEKGKKKGKVFVDDADSMLAIMGMVHAEKEGEREGKMMKARQLEEIREAKHLETQKRAEAKKEKFEAVKDELRGKGRRRSKPTRERDVEHGADKHKNRIKRVSFG